MLRAFFEISLWLVIGYVAVANCYWSALVLAAGVELVDHRRRHDQEQVEMLLGSSILPRVSMLAPAHNEEATVGESVRGLLTLQYPNLEVVLVNDGSTDATMEELASRFDLQPLHPVYRHVVPTKPVRGLYRSRSMPSLVVVNKDNGGKADSLNAGLNIATGALVCAIDADTLIEPDGLLRVVQPFLASEEVLASGGTIRVANGSVVRGGRVVVPRAPRRPLPGIQSVEYLRAFLFGRLGWNRLGGNLIISGAFGLFQRDALREIGGYQSDSIGEDMELVVRLRRRSLERGESGRVVFVPDPVAWTEAPGSLRVLGRQRDRWQRGLADVLVRHRRLIGNPRYGALGLVVAPYFVVVELVGPAVEVVGLVGLAVGAALGLVDASLAVLFALVAYGWGLLFSFWALALDELATRRYQRFSDRLLLVGWALLEPLGYRQLITVWQLRGLVRYLRGRSEWGTMVRRGFAPSPAPSTAHDRGTAQVGSR
jgi:cellulose synthase/poly-beta-1,6-N-acetylglucosamine synthase-like glycosyltransferase